MSQDLGQILAWRRQGRMMEAIGNELGISRQRVDQLINRAIKLGMAAEDPYEEFRQEREARRERDRLAKQVQALQERLAYEQTVIEKYQGKRFGALVVQQVVREPTPGGQIVWQGVVRCDCGTVSQMHLRNLKDVPSQAGNKSCGSKLHTKRGWTRRSAPESVFSFGPDTPA